MSVKPSIAILIAYFGEWPAWMNFFVESCRWNKDIQWVIFNDRQRPENRAPNVRHVQIAFEEYTGLVSAELGIDFSPSDPYKLCDVKPALPYVHRELLREYDFVGFGDLDVIYGDIRSFYDDETLALYDLLSTHADRVSGHLCLMRNSPDMLRAFEHGAGWKQAFTRPYHVGFDERAIYNLFRARSGWLRSARPSSRTLFREAYSTPGPTSDIRWFWNEGRLTNEFCPQHSFMYLHFMNWHSNRWFAHQPAVAADAAAPWKVADKIVRMDWRRARRDGFMVSRNGIESIPQERSA